MKEDIFSTSKAFVSVSDADYINMRPITEHIIALERVVYQSFYIVDFFKKISTTCQKILHTYAVSHLTKSINKASAFTRIEYQKTTVT